MMHIISKKKMWIHLKGMEPILSEKTITRDHWVLATDASGDEYIIPRGEINSITTVDCD